MLPTLLAISFAFFLELCGSSPVYNMQPAYITANIGTNGRNIRNLPCVSRKSNDSGVCMFAIDCLKANGTHLGTCIDRFYFGSCCHVETHNVILDNTIDPAIIPAREPPLRSSSTTEKGTTTKKIITTSTTTQTTTTTTEKERPLIPISTIRQPAPPNATEISIKSTTLTTPKPSEVPSRITPQEESMEEEFPFKLTTFQSVAENTIRETTTPKATTTTTGRTTTPKATTTERTTTTTITTKKFKPQTVKPVKPISVKPVTIKPALSSKPSSKPVIINETKPTGKPKPIRPISTLKPVKLTKPPTTKPTKATTKPPKLTTKKPVITTKLPRSTVPSTTATKNTTNHFTTSRPITLISSSTTQSVETTEFLVVSTSNSTKKPETTTKYGPPMNKIPVTTPSVNATSETVFGNLETNEIESGIPLKGESTTQKSETTTKATFITWTMPEDISNVQTTNTTSEVDWMPLTTPEWILLPNVPLENSTESSSTLGSTVPSTSTVSTTTVFVPTTSGTTKRPSSPASTITTLSSTTTTTPTSTSAPSTTNTKPTPTTETSTVQTETTTILNVTTIIPTNLTTPTSAPTYSTSTPSSNITISPIPSLNMSDYKQVCGTRMYPQARIVGGEKSSFGKWPWQISLRQWRTSTYLHKCGAALLNENWAITAAHCVDNVPPSDLLLRLGEHDLSTDSEPYLHQERRVQIVASHPQFDSRTFEYDLALLRFYEPVTFQPNIIPVCVPENDENFVGKTAYVTGWGRLYEDGPLPSVLQEVSVPVINNTVCESMYRSAGYIEHIPHIFICAGWRRGGFDSCEGDSGGPMVIQRPDKRFLLAGVISWGIGCAEPNQPGVYTRISEFKDWINQILQF